MGLQSCRSPNFGNFRTPKSWDKMTFGCWPHGQAQKILQGGRWWFPPSLDRGESWESMLACGSSVHWKCSSYALTNLLFGLCRSMWVIDLLVNLLSPHPKAPTHPSTPEVLQATNHTPTLSSFDVFTFGLAIESIKEPRGASLTYI